MTPVDMAPYFDAAAASAMWNSAKLWLVRWASAGFIPRQDGDKFFMAAGWVEKFPDGPMLVDMLRTEMTALIRDGNKAVLSDPRLKVAYPDYVSGMIDVECERLRHAERCVRKSQEEIERLKEELAAVKK